MTSARESLLASRGIAPDLRLFKEAGHRPTRTDGVPGRIRTCDLRFRKPLLYPTELRGLGSSARAFGQGRHPYSRGGRRSGTPEIGSIGPRWPVRGRQRYRPAFAYSEKRSLKTAMNSSTIVDRSVNSG